MRVRAVRFWPPCWVLLHAATAVDLPGGWILFFAGSGLYKLDHDGDDMQQLFDWGAGYGACNDVRGLAADPSSGDVVWSCGDNSLWKVNLNDGASGPLTPGQLTGLTKGDLAGKPKDGVALGGGKGYYGGHMVAGRRSGWTVEEFDPSGAGSFSTLIVQKRAQMPGAGGVTIGPGGKVWLSWSDGSTMQGICQADPMMQMCADLQTVQTAWAQYAGTGLELGQVVTGSDGMFYCPIVDASGSSQLAIVDPKDSKTMKTADGAFPGFRNLDIGGTNAGGSPQPAIFVAGSPAWAVWVDGTKLMYKKADMLTVGGAPQVMYDAADGGVTGPIGPIVFIEGNWPYGGAAAPDTPEPPPEPTPVPDTPAPPDDTGAGSGDSPGTTGGGSAGDTTAGTGGGSDAGSDSAAATAGTGGSGDTTAAAGSDAGTTADTTAAAGSDAGSAATGTTGDTTAAAGSDAGSAATGTTGDTTAAAGSGAGSASTGTTADTTAAAGSDAGSAVTTGDTTAAAGSNAGSAAGTTADTTAAAGSGAGSAAGTTADTTAAAGSGAGSAAAGSAADTTAAAGSDAGSAAAGSTADTTAAAGSDAGSSATATTGGSAGSAAGGTTAGSGAGGSAASTGSGATGGSGDDGGAATGSGSNAGGGDRSAGAAAADGGGGEEDGASSLSPVAIVFIVILLLVIIALIFKLRKKKQEEKKEAEEAEEKAKSKVADKENDVKLEEAKEDDKETARWQDVLSFTGDQRGQFAKQPGGDSPKPGEDVESPQEYTSMEKSGAKSGEKDGASDAASSAPSAPDTSMDAPLAASQHGSFRTQLNRMRSQDRMKSQPKIHAPAGKAGRATLPANVAHRGGRGSPRTEAMDDRSAAYASDASFMDGDRSLQSLPTRQQTFPPTVVSSGHGRATTPDRGAGSSRHFDGRGQKSPGARHGRAGVRAQRPTPQNPLPPHHNPGPGGTPHSGRPTSDGEGPAHGRRGGHHPQGTNTSPRRRHRAPAHGSAAPAEPASPGSPGTSHMEHPPASPHTPQPPQRTGKLHVLEAGKA